MTPWLYKNEIIGDIPETAIGFVYVITQISTGKKYIGKKKLFFKVTAIKTVTLKSGVKKKKKLRSLKESDYLTYYGSSDALKTEIEKCGVEDFTREILEFCETESMLSYQEAKIQFVTDALLYPDKYFNNWIMCRVRRDHLIKKIK